MSDTKLLRPEEPFRNSQNVTNHNNSSIGVLQSLWTSNNKIKAKNSGTAFLISSRIVLTCSHNVYSSALGRNADQIQFIYHPQKKGHSIQNQQSAKIIAIKRAPTLESFDISPLKEELCLLLLSQPVQTFSNKLSIGEFKVQPANQINQEIHVQSKKLPLRIVGYAKQATSSFSKTINNNPSELRGELDSIKQHVIHHTLSTELGHSGSPILAINEEGCQNVIGIHTHKGSRPGINSGLFFNEEILTLIKRYVQEFNEQFKLQETITVMSVNSKNSESKLDKSQIETEISQTISEQWEKTSEMDFQLYQDFFLIGSLSPIQSFQ